MDSKLITTAFTFDGFRITNNLGVMCNFDEDTNDTDNKNYLT